MNHLEALHHLLSLLPLQVVAGGLVPILQFARQRLRTRRAELRKQDLRARLVALQAFVSSLEQVKHDARARCLEDALLEQESTLKELASAIAAEAARPRRRPRNRLAWLFMLYQPPRTFGWVLRWSFFALLIVTVAGTIRAVLHENYVPAPVLVPFLITSFALAVLVRVAVFYLERTHIHRNG